MLGNLVFSDGTGVVARVPSFENCANGARLWTVGRIEWGLPGVDEVSVDLKEGEVRLNDVQSAV